MVKAGLTPMQAIVSATSTAARALKASDRLGSLDGRQVGGLHGARRKPARRYREHAQVGVGLDRGQSRARQIVSVATQSWNRGPRRQSPATGGAGRRMQKSDLLHSRREQFSVAC